MDLIAFESAVATAVLSLLLMLLVSGFIYRSLAKEKTVALDESKSSEEESSDDLETLMVITPLDTGHNFYGLGNSTAVLPASTVGKLLAFIRENTDKEIRCSNITSIINGEFVHKREELFYSQEDIIIDNVSILQPIDQLHVVLVRGRVKEPHPLSGVEGIKFIPVVNKDTVTIGYSPF